MVSTRTVAMVTQRTSGPFCIALASALFLGAGLARAADARMAVVKGKDLEGSVLKKIGLPSQDYCWSECLKDDRCTGARWGVISGDTAGLCMLLSGELTLKATSDLKTYDGQKILVTAGRKMSGGAKSGT
jgi:hypothetical protein